MLADAEVLKVFCELLDGFKLDFKLKLNDRQLLELAVTDRAGTPPEMFATICNSLDKLDKEPWSAVAEELRAKGLSYDQVQRLGEFVSIEAGSFESTIGALSQMFEKVSNESLREQVLQEMRLLREYMSALEIEERVKLDCSLARGLDYYTGMIFEAVIAGGEEAKLGLGSIAAGGRYDNLIGMFSKQQIPSAGGSLGIERIFNILEERASKEQALINPIDVVVG